MNPNHLVATLLGLVIFFAFVRDLRSAARPAPIRMRSDRRQVRD